MLVLAIIISLFTSTLSASATPVTEWWDVTDYAVGTYTNAPAGLTTATPYAGQRVLTGTLNGSALTITHYWGWYVDSPNNTKQRINIYVPSNATDKSAVFFVTNNSGWTSNNYPAAAWNDAFSISTSGANPAQNALAIARGMIVVTYGARSINDAAVAGVYSGHSPATMTDTKAAIRFVKYNMAYGSLPGNPDRVIITGTSGGGALTVQLAASGNHPDYYPSLYQIGALGLDYDGTEYTNNALVGDNVFATVSYCPMQDMTLNDTSAEWDYSDWRIANTATPVGGRTGTAYIYPQWQLNLSTVLKNAFPAYAATYGMTTAEIEAAVGTLVENSLNRYLSGVNNVGEVSAPVTPAALATLLGTNINAYAGTLLDWYEIDSSGKAHFTDYTAFTKYQFYTGQFCKGTPISSGIGLAGGAAAYSYAENYLLGTTSEQHNYVNPATWAMKVGNWGTWADAIFATLPPTATDNEKKAAMFETVGGVLQLKQEAYDAYYANAPADLIFSQAKMASPLYYLTTDAADCDTAPYWYVRHGLRDDGVNFAPHGMLYTAISKNDKIVDFDYQFIVNQQHAGSYDNIVAFEWVDAALAEAATTKVNITGPSAVTYLPGKTVTYTVSLVNAPDVTAAQLTLRLYGDYLYTKDFAGLNGFEEVGGTSWVNVGGGIWEGTFVLAGSGASGNIDVFQIELDLVGLLGVTAVELADFKIAFEGNWVDFTEGIMIVATVISQWFSPYDLNEDGVVDLRDISIAMMYYMAEAGDANWAEAVIADVNEDGVVDIEDLILIRSNFT